ncbi:MAG: type III pantothenate kinase [Gemmatimonadetes bacterium]|nr:type III pantothenate kinase [Gemmatimonadota bacterium]MDA1103995.1 type III pantothenate kinase [Gemmatimonadota bacterium]
MQLVVDVGNTETVVGVASSPTQLVADWRISSSVPRTADELTVLIRAFLAGASIDEKSIVQGVVGSVVPSVNYVWSKTLRTISGADVVSVGPESKLPIRLDVEEPLSVGADRIVNTLAARELYHRDTIAVDLGTATTFDCITGDGVFMGGVISPGLRAGLDWLSARTAKLPRVELQPPDLVIGRRTETCIQSGVFFSAIEAIDGIVRRIKVEWDRPDAYVVATGGFAHSIAPYLTTVDEIEPFLTLYGLAMAGEHLGRTAESP